MSVCTRPSPHECRVNGPCNGLPKPKLSEMFANPSLVGTERKADVSRPFPCVKCGKFNTVLGQAYCEMCEYGHRAKKCPDRINVSTYAETKFIHGRCKPVADRPEIDFSFVAGDKKYTITGEMQSIEKRGAGLSPSGTDHIVLEMWGHVVTESVPNEWECDDCGAWMRNGEDWCSVCCEKAETAKGYEELAAQEEAARSAKLHQVGGDHYIKYKIQPFDIIDCYGLGFYAGNALKYLLRYRDKGGVEDLKKARHYIDKLIEVTDGDAEG